MDIDFNTAILDLKGHPVSVENNGMTVGTCAIAALQHLFPGEDLSPEQKVKRFKLAVKISGAEGPLAMTAEDVAVVKQVVGKFWNPLVCGRCWETLDPESVNAL